ncbi:hydrogenase nickel incorporation protein HypB [Candidatus Altiarchaeota archaeon]
MCDECGCNERTIRVEEPVLKANDDAAIKNKSFLSEKGILCANILGSPGSGKTSLIEGLAGHIPPAAIAVIQGDLESEVDKLRLEGQGITCYQINTHSGCHLNAIMVANAIGDMILSGKKYLFIENVGNLVCPAGIALGQHVDLVVSSTCEGSDKPRKYPLIFMDADAIIISKTDLTDAVGFIEEDYLADLRKINGRAGIFRVSCKDADSFRQVANLLEHEWDHLTGAVH